METDSSASQPSARLSFWVALLTAVSAAIALAVAVTTLPRSGPYCQTGCVVTYPYTDAGAFVPRDYLWLYPGLLVTALAVVLAGCLHDWVPPRRRTLSRVGAMFVMIAAGILVIDYAVQLTVLQPALLAGQTEGLSAWSSYHPYGLFIALENAGYATLNVGFGFLGAAWASGLVSRAARMAGWVFLGGAAMTAAALVYYPIRYGSQLDYRFEVAAIAISWLVLIIAPAMLAWAFAHRGVGAPQAGVPAARPTGR
ncbi:hypothetical protein MLP_30690 [Microlunatus phosphovorus NM-1]|uniref:DUF998 domain-containing protein n=1 Tax=Microlunatus phosphovorus (strain ATCC 700054 / DSM 10555 / JCM 9379 / NBRC 101784 / NCIMB 13414 / VKM Ac-1990 / NM-1) TaxID=1032480 RepID=F5XKL1_MICPN|nr:hypothetical protein [Microlunatus phosphovorus]BAK36083.1 hypothetical protein MLP_30690 [Microlunatus phosphovorus NM-1]